MSDNETILRLEARIVELEEFLTHQQKLVQDLNEVVIDQQLRLSQLELHTTRLSAQAESILASIETPRRPEDEKPPHY